MLLRLSFCASSSTQRNCPTLPSLCAAALTVVLGCLGQEISAAPAANGPLAVVFDPAVPQCRFAADEIAAALARRGEKAIERPLTDVESAPHERCIYLASTASESSRLARRLGLAAREQSQWQSYGIRKLPVPRAGFAVLATDPAGAMYGGLDLAEAIRLGTLGATGDSDHAPHVERRGIKFNIPLDLRTPSYSDCSDAFQANIPEMWSMDFWREMLDAMARHRYNVLSLWSLHPFPSLVKVPEFPEVALNDVWRTRVKLDDSFSHSGSDMLRPEMLADVEVVKRISIDEKIRFWRAVMDHAHDRGIEVYLFTWNLFTFAAEGKHGITSSQTNPTTIAYFRASVRETILTYPHLAGLGVTAGEQMENRRDEFSKEKWLWKTYGEGVRDAKKVQPARQVRLIHRFHMTGQSEILREWKDYPDTFDFSFKYSIAHMYSVPNPPFIEPVLKGLAPGRRTWLTVRNDDIYSFRWGDPTFAREYVRAMPGPDKMAGFYMGPDGYCWGRELLSTEPDAPRQLVLDKQWYSFLLWGRLAYDPALPDVLFQRILAERFPQVPAEKLLAAWSEASRIFPQITCFFWGDIDLRWLPEACLSHARHKGFYTVQHFVEGETMPASGILNIRQWRRRLLDGQPMNGTTPPQVADALQKHADRALAGVEDLRRSLSTDSATTTAALRDRESTAPEKVAGAASKGPPSKELRLTLGDLEAFAHVGHYYAEKTRGASELALFDATGRAEHRQAAVEHLRAALGHWKRYAEIYARQYKPALYNRVGFVDIPALAAKVEQDIAIASNWKPGTVRDQAPSGKDADRPFQP